MSCSKNWCERHGVDDSSDADVVIEVTGGVADIRCQPEGITVEIIDYDNLQDETEESYSS